MKNILAFFICKRSAYFFSDNSLKSLQSVKEKQIDSETLGRLENIKRTIWLQCSADVSFHGPFLANTGLVSRNSTIIIILVEGKLTVICACVRVAYSSQGRHTGQLDYCN